MTPVLTLDAFDRERAKSVIVDVLPRGNYRLGHIPGALNWPVDEIPQLAPRNISDRAARIVVYCASPSCPLGARAVATLAGMGYRNTSLFPGGIEEWTASGRGLERSHETSRNERRERVINLISAMTIRQWVSLWFTMILFCASMYWLGSLTPWPGLAQDGNPVRSGWNGFGDCIYFSFVTATTVGYGDIVPSASWARALAAIEAMGGMVLVGAVISRLLSSQQEKLLQETHELAFNERLGRMQNSLHLLISEFQDLELLHIEGKTERAKSHLRFSSGATILLRDLTIVKDLLQQRVEKAEEGSLELLLFTLNSALQAYLDVLSHANSTQLPVTTQVAQVVSDICTACMPSGVNHEMRKVIGTTELLAQQIMDAHVNA